MTSESISKQREREICIDREIQIRKCLSDVLIE
jgi:hypothetical protein